MLEVVIFYISALVAIGGAVMMIAQRNPVASVLYLIVSLVAQAVLYIQLQALFVGALLVIVYAGAILVLFLFVIMLLNLRGEKFGHERSKVSLATKLVFSFLMIVELAAIAHSASNSTGLSGTTETLSPGFGSVPPVAELLYTKYLFPFELTSILLLVAVVGAVMMARRDKIDREKDVV